MSDSDTFQGTTTDDITVITASDGEIGITTRSHNELGLAWLSPQTARDLAAHLVKLADKLEGKADG